MLPDAVRDTQVLDEVHFQPENQAVRQTKVPTAQHHLAHVRLAEENRPLATSFNAMILLAFTT